MNGKHVTSFSPFPTNLVFIPKLGKLLTTCEIVGRSEMFCQTRCIAQQALGRQCALCPCCNYLVVSEFGLSHWNVPTYAPQT